MAQLATRPADSGQQWQRPTVWWIDFDSCRTDYIERLLLLTISTSAVVGLSSAISKRKAIYTGSFQATVRRISAHEFCNT